MSRFVEKIRAGVIPTDEDWFHHVEAYHATRPSRTSRAVHLVQESDGRNSYQILADSVTASSSSGPVVLDLACGDGSMIPHILTRVGAEGQIIGLDTSGCELAVARRLYSEPNVTIVQGKAQAIPLADESVDFILCHLALMLMSPADPVIMEVARVLKKGGVFAAVTDDPYLKDSLFRTALRMIRDFVTERYPVFSKVRPGDARVFQMEGIRELFRPELGFEDHPTLRRLSPRGRFTREDAFIQVQDTYLYSILTDEEQAELDRRIEALFAPNYDPDGTLVLDMPLIEIIIRRLD